MIAPNLTADGFFEYTESDSDLGSNRSETNIEDLMLGGRIALVKETWFASATFEYGVQKLRATVYDFGLNYI